MKAIEEIVWVVTGMSESGHDYGPKVYHEKPNDDVLRPLAFEWDGDVERPNGRGNYGSHVYLDIQRVGITASNSKDK